MKRTLLLALALVASAPSSAATDEETYIFVNTATCGSYMETEGEHRLSGKFYSMFELAYKTYGLPTSEQYDVVHEELEERTDAQWLTYCYRKASDFGWY